LRDFAGRAKDAKNAEGKQSFPFATFALFAQSTPLPAAGTA
jgi:hypothetical protein